MGIKKLTRYIETDNSGKFTVKRHLRDVDTIIVDNFALLINAYSRSGHYFDVAYGGDYASFLKFFQNFITNMKNCGINLIFVFDVNTDLSKLETALKRREAHAKDGFALIKKYKNGEPVKYPGYSNLLSLNRSLQFLLEKNNVEMKMVEGDVDNFIIFQHLCFAISLGHDIKKSICIGRTSLKPPKDFKGTILPGNSTFFYFLNKNLLSIMVLR